MPPLLRKILTTTVSGGTTLLITVLTKQELIPSVNLSVLVGSVALLVEFLVEFDARLTETEQAVAERTEQMRALVTEGFAQVNRATALYDQLQKAPLANGVMTQLAENLAGLGGEHPPIVSAFTQRELRRLADLMKELKAGQAAYDGEDQDWLLTLTHSSAIGIDAISTAVDTGFWSTELGRRYLEAQRAAVRRGVPVRRVFVVRGAEPQELAEIERAGRTHQQLGLEVRVLEVTALPPWARRPMSDFIVFDRAVSYEVQTDTSGRQDDGTGPELMVASTLLVLREEQVNRRIQRFEYLWAVARPLDGPTP
ncbi:DUF6879 family protein [Kitasatospora viridis]|uniref:DUF6879 family protein n=1 Tax=Kitasatospora viridis TaxID=281105 RepID=UPI0011A24E9C|nr:DUF6879 family protein [Kitasatospora viridis]